MKFFCTLTTIISTFFGVTFLSQGLFLGAWFQIVLGVAVFVLNTASWKLAFIARNNRLEREAKFVSAELVEEDTDTKAF